MVDWSGYQPYDYRVAAPLSELPRAEARRAYDHLMASKPARIAMLGGLVAANGTSLDGFSDKAIQHLNDWFYRNVEPDPEQPGRLLPEWYSVVVDIALFLGDALIERHPHLHWEFFTWGRRNLAYQQPVIMGFRHEDPKHHTNIDLEPRVAAYGHRIVRSRGSVPAGRSVQLKGSTFDLDALLAGQRKAEVETDAFVRWLAQVAAREA